MPRIYADAPAIVAAMVIEAGGEVRVPNQTLRDLGQFELIREDDVANGCFVYRVRKLDDPAAG